RVGVVKFHQTNRSGDPIAPLLDFEVVRLGAVVEKGGIIADPDLVFTARIGSVVEARSRETAGSRVHDRRNLVASGKIAVQDCDRRSRTPAKNCGATGVRHLHRITPVCESGRAWMGWSAIQIHSALAAVDVQIDPGAG